MIKEVVILHTLGLHMSTRDLDWQNSYSAAPVKKLVYTYFMVGKVTGTLDSSQNISWGRAAKPNQTTALFPFQFPSPCFPRKYS